MKTKFVLCIALFISLMLSHRSFSAHIALGERFILAIDKHGDLWSWEKNENRLLGLKQISLRNIIEISAGKNHALALDKEGNVWSFNHITPNTEDNNKPLDGIRGIIKISVSDHHNLALDKHGQVWSWGNGGSGQLGHGTIEDQTRPLLISSLSRIIKISAGSYHSIALDEKGQVWSWGFNSYGRLGVGDERKRLLPTQINSFSNARDIIACSFYSIVLDSDGLLWQSGLPACFNHPGYTEGQMQPFFREKIGPITQIAAHGPYFLAMDNEHVFGWGFNNWHQLKWSIKEGVNLDDLTTPQIIASLKNINTVYIYSTHCLAIDSLGEVWNWHNSTIGSLNVNNSNPKKIQGLQMKPKITTPMKNAYNKINFTSHEQ